MLLLLHGALGAATQFGGLLPLLSSGTPVFALNLPGHGGLPPGEKPFSLPIFAEAVLRFLDEKNQPRASFFGYSMGGYVALYLAARHPDRVAQVAMLNTKLVWSPEVAQRMQGMMNPEKIEAKAPPLAAQLAATHAPEDWKTVARLTGDFLHTLANGAALPEAALRQIACPVLLLRGANDNVVSAEECQRAAGLMPSAVYREIAESGHLLEQVNIRRLAEEIEAFSS